MQGLFEETDEPHPKKIKGGVMNHSETEPKKDSEIKATIRQFENERSESNLLNLLTCLHDSEIWIPCNMIMSEADTAKFQQLLEENKDNPDAVVGRTLFNSETIRMVPDILQSGEDYFFPVFTSVEEMGEYGNHFSKIQDSFLHAIVLARNNEKQVAGIVINAFSEAFVAENAMLEFIESLLHEA